MSNEDRGFEDTRRERRDYHLLAKNDDALNASSTDAVKLSTLKSVCSYPHTVRLPPYEAVFKKARDNVGACDRNQEHRGNQEPFIFTKDRGGSWKIAIQLFTYESATTLEVEGVDSWPR